MVEKRGARRCRITQMIGYYPGREQYHWAEGVDLSSEGLSCISDEPIDPLTSVYMMMEIEVGGTTRNLRFEGFVRHSNMEEGRCHFGVKIENLSTEDKAFLEAFLAESGCCEDEGCAG